MKVYSKLVFIFFIFLLISCKKDPKNSEQDSEIRDRYFNLEKIGWKSRSYTQVVNDIGFTATELLIQYYSIIQISLVTS